MTSPIDPIRRAANLRRTRRKDLEPEGETHETEGSNLPVPVETPAATGYTRPLHDSAAVFAAHLIGQDGQKRGLRAGATVIDRAKATYNQTEWSGSADRRTRKGRITKTEI